MKLVFKNVFILCRKTPVETSYAISMLPRKHSNTYELTALRKNEYANLGLTYAASKTLKFRSESVIAKIWAIISEVRLYLVKA